MPIQTLLNSRKGAVLEAEQALKAACATLDSADLSHLLQQSEQALRAAGWQHAARFNQALLTAVPFMIDDEEQRPSFEAALIDFTQALCRCNLNELACSTQLIEHYRVLSASANPERSAMIPFISFDEFALAERLVPQAWLRTELKADDIISIRERYEQALLIVLRTSAQQIPPSTEIALEELNECLAALAHPSPYNFWHLASACLRAQLQAGCAYDEHAKRLYARYNLLLHEQMKQMKQIEAANGIARAPSSVVRASVALLWRAFAIEGAAPNSGEYVQLLRDYGLSVAWRQLDFDEEQVAEYTKGMQLLYEADNSTSQQIGALAVTQGAYEDFLAMADLSVATLAKYTDAAMASDKPQAGLALQASESAYWLTTLASQIGLVKLAWLAEMLGLAWRRYAYIAAQLIEVPSPEVLQEGSAILEEKLKQFSSGRLPDEIPEDYCAQLTEFIESMDEC